MVEGLNIEGYQAHNFEGLLKLQTNYALTHVFIAQAEYEENTERLNELAVDSGAIERIAREKYLMKKPNEDIYVFEEDIEK